MAVANLAAFGLAYVDLGIPWEDFEFVDGLSWIRSRLLVLGGLQWLFFLPPALWLGPRLGYDRSSIGLDRPDRPLHVVGGGALLGAALLLGPAAVGRLVGGFTEGAAVFTVPSWVAAFGVLFVMALGEEVLFRGILLRLWVDRLGPRGALVLTTLLFTVLHTGNPGVDLLGTFGVLLAGVLLGLAALRSGGVWWPFGVHLGWNVATGLIVGLPVSGISLPSLVRWLPVGDGPSLWGGDFGPEAGLAFHTALLVGIVVVARPRGSSGSTNLRP